MKYTLERLRHKPWAQVDGELVTANLENKSFFLWSKVVTVDELDSVLLYKGEAFEFVGAVRSTYFEESVDSH